VESSQEPLGNKVQIFNKVQMQGCKNYVHWRSDGTTIGEIVTITYIYISSSEALSQKVQISMKASWPSTESCIFKSWPYKVRLGCNREKSYLNSKIVFIRKTNPGSFQSRAIFSWAWQLGLRPHVNFPCSDR
jgi:hypothetical protein